MKNHFIICAYGRVGRTAAREFEAEGTQFVVIDKDPDLEQVMTRDGVIYISGDPTVEGTLQSAGIERARGIVSAVDSDADNVFITLAARSLNPRITIVARASQEATAERLYRAGADRVVSPYVTSGRQMALACLRPRVLDHFYIGHREPSNLRIDEVRIEEGSNLAGRSLGDVVGKTLALAIRRADGQILANPSSATRLGTGDLLVLLGDPDSLRPLEEQP